MEFTPLLNIVLALLIAPVFPGVINRTKAFFAGRRGRPLLQLYFDVFKLIRKGAVYSRTTTFVFRAGPVVGLAAAAAALAVLPMGGARSAVSFTGDFVMFAYLFGLARFFTVLAALDTGSSFEGMGASREAAFSALAEPVLFLGLVSLVRHTGGASLSDFFLFTETGISVPAFSLVAASLFLVMLAENSRVPIDDPNTHLELTMIHEVMVLDHGGPDLAFITYGSALKFWAYGSLVVGALLPLSGMGASIAPLLYVLGMIALAVLVGVVESIMARIRLLRVPQYMAGSAALAVFALALSFTR